MIPSHAGDLKLSRQFNKPEKYIGPGEFYSSADDVVISTLLGSCISVALYDPVLRIGGLNHFMLPHEKTHDASLVSTSTKYGVNAMETLINDILKKGARKERFRAKVFGGGTVLDFQHQATYDVPKMNITFAFEFLEAERIPVDSYSVGGERPRKIYFFPRELRVLMKFSATGGQGIAHRENRYSHELLEAAQNAGKPILF